MPLGHLEAATEEVAAQIVDAAYHVHTAMGPGLLESVYEQCMAFELGRRGVSFRRQVVVPLVYKGVALASGLRLDLLVADLAIVELKSVDRLTTLYEAQILSYLKLTNLRLGLIVNFNVPTIKSGIKRIVR